MRAVIIVSILFIILLSLTFINANFINSTSGDLISTVQSIPDISSDNCLEKIKDFEQQWTKFKKAALYTVSHSELSKISCFIEELYVHFYNQDEKEFKYCTRKLLNGLEEISRFERLSIDAIF